jgi:hypothetical protein
LKSSPTFRQEVKKKFRKFSSYSFDELKQEKSKLQNKESQLQEEKNKLQDKENLLLQRSLSGIKPFHFLTINDI